MFRYLLLDDGFAALNASTMLQLAADQKTGWTVSDVLSVHLFAHTDGSYKETTIPNQGFLAAKIILV